MSASYFRKASDDVTFSDAKNALRLLRHLGYERRVGSAGTTLGSYAKGDSIVSARRDLTRPELGAELESSVHVDVSNASSDDLERTADLLVGRGFERFDLFGQTFDGPALYMRLHGTDDPDTRLREILEDVEEFERNLEHEFRALSFGYGGPERLDVMRHDPTGKVPSLDVQLTFYGVSGSDELELVRVTADEDASYATVDQRVLADQPILARILTEALGYEPVGGYICGPAMEGFATVADY